MLVALCLAPESQAQFAPVVAKIRATIETSQGGKLIKTENKEGLYYRSSDGSTLTRWVTINGDENLGGDGELFDNKGLAVYNLNFRYKQATQINDAPIEKASPDEFKNLTNSKLGDDSIEGIRCRRGGTAMRWPDGHIDKTGEYCASIEYALTLREDEKLTQKGVTRHATKEMYEIKLGVEPDPKLFDVSAQFQVLRPEHSAAELPKK